VTKKFLVGGLVTVAAVVGLSGPAIAVVDLTVKRAIIGVVLDNLGVEANDAFVTALAKDLDTTELDGGLVTAVTNVLDTGTDPRAIIESQTDSDGDGVPDEGAALAVDDHEPNPNSTEKASNSDDKSENSSNRNPNGTTNSGKSDSGKANGGGTKTGNDDSTDDNSGDNSGTDGNSDDGEDEPDN
jgi:hypothetical protein